MGIVEIKSWEVWCEGFKTTGSAGTAQFLGKFSAISFNVAVEIAIIEKGWDLNYFDKQNLTYYGCHFFDNEIDARKNFG